MSTVTATVSINTNPDVAGRYSVDVRTAGGRQMMVKATDAPAILVGDLTDAGLKAGVLVEMVDETGE